MERSWVSVPGGTIIELLQHWCLGPQNDTPAFVSVNAAGVKRQISRSDIFQMCSRFAARLKALGISKGQIVCNTLPNSLERVVCEFGIILAGAVSMNGQIFRTDGEDFFESLRTSQCSMVIVDADGSKGARQVLLKHVSCGCEDNPGSDAFPHLRKLVLCSRNDLDPSKDFLSSLNDKSLPQFVACVQPTDMATVMTTSGSTGYSKLVKLTHANICHFAAQVKNIEPLLPGAKFINCAPLGWAGGYPQWFLGCGVTRYFVDVYDGPVENLPEVIWGTIVREEVEYGFLSPMYVNAILNNESQWRDVRWKPRILCLAGQPVKQNQLAIIGKLCDAVDINYGATECNLISTHRITDPSQFSDSCAGFPGYGVKIKIVDQDRQELPAGETGEVLLWSPSLCTGYLGNEAATRKAFTEDGWFCTDDAGYVGADGKLFLQGRQSDCIMRGSYILYPGWLEAKLRDLPGINDVVIVPVPDLVLHNEICACVVVDGIVGVAAGLAERELLSENGEDCLDDVDNIVFEDKSKIFAEEGIEKVTLVSKFGFKNEAERLSAVQKTFDMIRSQGQTKPLSVPYNVTSVKPHSSASKAYSQDINHTISDIDLVRLEKHIREYAGNLELLNKTDAMRMVPKYYVFMEKLPLTNTGKLNRKEIKALATSTLKLS